MTSKFIKNLTLEAAVSAPSSADPVEQATVAFTNALGRQLAAAQAMLRGEEHPDVKRPWFFKDQSGRIVLRLRVGNSVFALVPGKPDIIIEKEEALTDTIVQIIAEAKRGGFKDQIGEALAQNTKRREKNKAAKTS